MGISLGFGETHRKPGLRLTDQGPDAKRPDGAKWAGAKYLRAHVLLVDLLGLEGAVGELVGGLGFGCRHGLRAQSWGYRLFRDKEARS